jgi:glucose/arabinose dehydrogenase
VRPGGSVLTVPGAVPAGAVAAVLNVTTTESPAPGFVTVHPCGPPVPETSNGNYVPGVTQATAAIGAAGPTGQVCVLTSGATQLVVDRAGWFVAPGPRPRLGAAAVGLTAVGTGTAVTDLVARPGDATGLFVAERAGRVRLLRAGALTTVLDPPPGIVAGGERGLLGLAFSPDGSRAYVNYTAGSPLQTRVVEYAVGGDGRFSAARELLRFDQPFDNHNGGDLEVDGGGLLYIASGDGGSGGDPGNRAQDLGTLLGKILRIDPRPSGAAPYAIPAGNPFAGLPGARPEIWAFGLRNPWRIDLDAATGDLWIADVGQDQREEVNVGRGGGAGANYGWRRWEGTRLYAAGTAAPAAVPPRYEYAHGPGCSITGGFVYRGARIPALQGAYVFSDFCAGGVRAIDPANPAAGAVEVTAGLAQASTFGIGPDGELYAATIAGTIVRLDPA